MQRAQRALDNPALDVAVEIANALHQPVVVFFAPVPFYPHANLRHYAFLAQGIPDIAERARKRGIGFVLRHYPDHRLPSFCEVVEASIVIGDENPLREPGHWRELAAKKLSVPLWTVDADVIVPSKLLEKEQYAARIVRPRLRCAVRAISPAARRIRKPRWNGKSPRICSALPDDGSFDITHGWKTLDRSVAPVDSFRGGTIEALKLLRQFVAHKLAKYPERHGKPEVDGTSRLSPYLHFGHISPITVALAVENSDAPRAVKDDFLDQLITWRELATNFAYFNKLYDSLESAPDWAHRTLADHASDKRPVIYAREQLEAAETHDELWERGPQSGRCYTPGGCTITCACYVRRRFWNGARRPQVAYQTAVYLNDKYFLDGRDPNGYAGIAWSIAGKFDRPWFERPIFGTIRYMSSDAARKKFDADSYIAQMSKLAGNDTKQGQGSLFR